MENVQKKAEIIVFAGPNGSGKSTFTEILRPSQMDYINADEIKKNLKCDDLEAAQIAERQREACLSDKREFCFETVLSTSRNLELLKRAREMGCFIRCYYVLTIAPIINVYRVKTRVASGGHDVPKEKIFDICRAMRDVQVTAPVHIGDVILPDICGTGVNLVATREINLSSGNR